MKSDVLIWNEIPLLEMALQSAVEEAGLPKLKVVG